MNGRGWLLAGALFLMTCSYGWAQCLPVVIFVSDYNTQKPVQAQIFVRLYGQHKPLGSTNEAGQLVLSFPCSATELIVEKSGYQSLSLPLTIGQKSAIELPYYVPLSLIVLDKQSINRPYSQSEQKQYVLKNTTRSQDATEFRLFKVTDAMSGSVLSAEICLFYTKNPKKDCFKTSLTLPTIEVAFAQPDIVAIEVKAEGYQRYQGNLILETFEGKRQVYEIKLSRQLTIFTAYVKSDVLQKKAALYDPATGRTVEMKSPTEGQFTSLVEEGRAYRWRVLDNQNQEIHGENLIFLAGLNQRAVAVKQPLKNPEPPPLPTKMAPTEPPLSNANEYILYFEQSTYELSAKTSQQLEQWAAWWRQNITKKIQVYGHTDNVGDARLNQLLSENRAKVVATYLFNQGVADSCVLYRGFGPHRPASTNDTEQNRQKNRRVEIRELAF